MKKYFIIMIGLLLQTNFVFSQWVQTNGPYGNTNVLSIINNDSFLLTVTSSGYFSKTQLSNEWILNSKFNFSCYTKIGDSLFVANNYNGIKLINLKNLNDPPIDVNSFTPKTLSHSGYTLYGGDENQGFFKSNNYGQSWVAFNLGLPIDTFPNSPTGPLYINNVSCIEVVNNYIYCGTSHGMYRNTTDLNSSWIEVNTGLPTLLVTLIKQFNDTLYTVFSNDLYRSVDYGNTWEFLNSAPSKITSVIQCNDIVYIGTKADGIYYSVDNGINWNSFNAGLLDLNITEFATYDATLICGTNSQGVFCFQNGQWIKNEPGMICSSIRSMSVVNNNLISNDNDKVYKLNSNGNWTDISPTVEHNYFASLSSMNDTLFLSVGHITANYPFDNHFIVYSPDNGISWDSLIHPVPFARDDAYRIYTEAGKLYAFEDEQMYYTDNLGLSWTNISLPPQYCNNFMGFIVNNGIPFASTCESGQILKLNNNQNWIYSNNGLPTNSTLNAFAKCDNALLAYINNNGLYVSYDNGDNWTSLNNDIVTNYGIRGFVSYDSNLFITNGYGVFGSNNCGQDWVSINKGLRNLDVGSISILNDTLYVVTYGSGIWKRALTEINFARQDDSTDDSLLIYPNPASDFIHIVTDSEQARFRIMDMLGKVILYGELNSMKKINISGINNGIYVVFIQSDDKRHSSKLIINR